MKEHKHAKKAPGFFEKLEENDEAKTNAAILVLIVVLAIILQVISFAAPTQSGIAAQIEPSAVFEQEKNSAKPVVSFDSCGEYAAKVFLIKKYGPSICFGQPFSPSDQELTKVISQNSDESLEALKQSFATASDTQIYERMTQMNQVIVTAANNSANSAPQSIASLGTKSYNYIIFDGKCCSMSKRIGTAYCLQGQFYDQSLGIAQEPIPCSTP